MAIKYGYAQISTAEQNLNLQIDALKSAGCSKLYKEKISAVKERPELDRMLEDLQEGDTVVVWKLDRLGRSLKHLIELVNLFLQKGVNFISLQEHLNTTTAQGKFIFNVFGAIAEFERNMIRARTKAGLESARARGRLGGRPAKLSRAAEHTALFAQKLYHARELTINEICKKAGISKRTLYKYIRLDLSHLEK